MVETIENADLLDRSESSTRDTLGRSSRNSLADALVGPTKVEVVAVAPENRRQVLLAQDEDVVEALRFAHCEGISRRQRSRWVLLATSPIRLTQQGDTRDEDRRG